MTWLKKYETRLMSADDAVKAIESNWRVFLTGNCSVPQKLLAALVKRAKTLENVEIVQVLTIGPAPHIDPEMEGHIRVNTLFISPNIRKAAWPGIQSQLPLVYKWIYC